MTNRYPGTAQFIAQEAPIESFYCLSKQALENQVQRFISGFSGVVAYAVKANPAPELVHALAACGIRAYDVASIAEVARAKSLLSGEQSGDPRSPHCFDQARLYTQGRFKDVAYYREGVLARAQSIYQPGAESATNPEAGHARQQGLQSD